MSGSETKVKVAYVLIGLWVILFAIGAFTDWLERFRDNNVIVLAYAAVLVLCGVTILNNRPRG